MTRTVLITFLMGTGLTISLLGLILQSSYDKFWTVEIVGIGLLLYFIGVSVYNNGPFPHLHKRDDELNKEWKEFKSIPRGA